MGLAAAPSSRTAGGIKAGWSRMARTGQVASSFAAVVCAYFLYWLIAVPLIEPGLEPTTAIRATEADVEAARNAVGARQREMAKFFPAGSWELSNPAIWESERARLLFKNLRPLPDGTVELAPCTVLFFPKNAAADTDAANPPIIMRAVEGARVRFDEPIVLKSVDLSKRRLVGGRLMGPIRIYRTESRPGANDELEITTRDVEMLQDRVWTPHPVQFRLGRNHGSGREMEILLAESDAPAAKAGFRAGTMRTLELKRDVKMQMELGGPLQPPAASRGQARQSAPLDITCQGPFKFDIQSYAASFHDQVDVVWPNDQGEADQLNCKVLTVVFDPRRPKPAEGKPAEPAGSTPLSSLTVRVIQARGDPVTIRSPRRGIYARCCGVDYAPGIAGATGSFLAIGPGIMQRNLPNDPAGRYDAAWAREFRFEPDGPQHVATLRGAATLHGSQMGKITADEIFAWLTPQAAPPAGGAGPAPGANNGWQFERALAQVYPQKSADSQEPVKIKSPQLQATTDRLEVWVERPAATAAAGPTGAAPEPAAPSPVRKAQAPQQNPDRRFEASGRRIQIKMLPNADQLAVSDVTIENQASLKELTPAGAGQRPLVVHGDRLHVAAANTDDMRVTVSGRPGHLEAAGITLDGLAIEMERKTNRLWIDGPGRMTMPIEQDLNGQALARPQSLAVNWQGGMDFRADTVVFKRAVDARSEHQLLRTERLEAVLTRAIDFSTPARPPSDRPEDRPQLARILSVGPTFLESREFDEQGAATAHDQMRASDLAIDNASGAINGRGPGSVTRVSRGSNRALEARTAAPATAPPARSGRSGDELTYLNVNFQTSIVGNLHRREVTFGDATKTVYGPVNDWEATLRADDPASLGPQGMVLDARQLTVREMPAQNRQKRGSVELEARGNVVGEGTGFTARGDRLTYSQEKDQLVLRGDGLSPAEFFQEDASGGPRRESTANELTYWLGLQRLLVTGFKSFGVDMPNPPKKKTDGK